MHFYFPFLITPFDEKVKEEVDYLGNKREKSSKKINSTFATRKGLSDEVIMWLLAWLPESGIVTLTVDNVEVNDDKWGG